MGFYDAALQAFEKLHMMIPNAYEVLYQIGNLYEVMGMRQLALKWFNILIARLPNDSEILSRMGYLC